MNKLQIEFQSKNDFSSNKKIQIFKTNYKKNYNPKNLKSEKTRLKSHKNE